MKVLIIGGDRHGEWIETLDNVTAWVDIRNAETRPIRKITSNVLDIRTGAVIEAYTVMIAVHPELTGPTEPAIVGQLLSMLAMNAWSREHGEPQKIPKEPAGSELIVPGS